MDGHFCTSGKSNTLVMTPLKWYCAIRTGQSTCIFQEIRCVSTQIVGFNWPTSTVKADSFSVSLELFQVQFSLCSVAEVQTRPLTCREMIWWTSAHLPFTVMYVSVFQIPNERTAVLVPCRWKVLCVICFFYHQTLGRGNKVHHEIMWGTPWKLSHLNCL